MPDRESSWRLNRRPIPASFDQFGMAKNDFEASRYSLDFSKVLGRPCLTIGRKGLNVRIALLSSMVAITFAASSSPFRRAAEAATEELAVVGNGVRANACFVGGEWQSGSGFLEAGGYDRWLLADRGLDQGDFHLKARLSIHGLDKSAARFAFNRGESSFGFEGSHDKIYITGVVAGGKETASALTDPKEAGIVDGQPFTFEVIRKDDKLTFSINGKPIRSSNAHDGPIPVLGFEPRRAVMRIEQFSIQGTFLADIYEDHSFGVWFHPQVTPVDTLWRGPFLNVPDDRVLTVVNHEGGVQAFVSEDDGKMWTEPVIVVRERGKRQSYPKVFERRPGELWITTWQGGQLFKLRETDFVDN